jgi:Arc/MetJ-type ribon-helix-helix transcriptional regulator
MAMIDTEKLTINISAVDLGKIDLLIQEAMYSNRTDFIRAAIRSQLERHESEIQQAIVRNAFAVGVLSYDRDVLEKYKAKGQKLKISVVGLLRLGSDISPKLANETVESISVRGILQASPEVKSALAAKMS